MESDSREFFRVMTLPRALDRMLEETPAPELHSESCPLMSALGRFLFADLVSAENIPPFTRSTMDGYAVRAADTYGASEGNPAYLAVSGRVAMGAAPGDSLKAGEAMAIPTGGMLPAGADAVVMIEHTAAADENTIKIGNPVSPGDNVVQAGEEVKSGQTLLVAGRRIRPEDMGALAAIGAAKVEVFVPLKVGILSTGDELVDVDEQPEAGRVRDINFYALAGLVQASGGEPVHLGICRDDAGALREKLTDAVARCQLVLISGGSSVGEADLTAAVISELKEPGVLVHGLAAKPGKSAIMAVVHGVPVFGLPGHPASAMDIYRQLVDPLLKFMYSGDPGFLERPRVSARLSRSLSSVAGREDRIRVVLEPRDGELWAVPVKGRSGLISLMVRTDGAAVIPFETEGLGKGDEVVVELF